MSKFRRARKGYVTANIRYACYLVHQWEFQLQTSFWIRCVDHKRYIWCVERAPMAEVARRRMVLDYEIKRRFG